ncbi:MAG: hypothetical protein A2Y00_05755 [Omnitrophica WOR_2 bacterium GWF2_43_52]|nr:MAG: hypothetical protein A2062_04620 [Omnitrophica WOR_2 bacterium GWA2_44_7]OGX16509.1 MAG: hypothetical protein A2Y01_00180 [Omnitrophica WOR_2 bacterium GWC2_44_8]OGX20603.1 MAG: hypothetical protein A2Y00_05755 [Omnitrophica WOR_2 bacterium GWF2_43_52]OGX59033.1 MAG: hypothetical protein A2460_01515 [Omnitrophica WOR_2 bacterium RIFOXYC2_FULL_43_9]HAH21577.1 hypothetical protein [Candidatus Omnitrophota bacterium]
MSFKNDYKIPRESGQSVMEYVLLVSICLITILGLNFIVASKDSARSGFSSHFNTVKDYLLYTTYE